MTIETTRSRKTGPQEAAKAAPKEASPKAGVPQTGAPPGEPLAFAAQLLGRAPPPEVPFAEAAPTMSPLALSFWQDCRRVRNDELKRELGVTLRYPTYREGLRALAETL